MHDRIVGTAVIASYLAAFGCHATMLPPVLAPEQTMPPVVAPPPPAGNGQLAIAADEPSVVKEPSGTSAGVTPTADVVSGVAYTTVCDQTPCAVDLPLGKHELVFTSLADPNRYGTGSVVVTHQPTDYRYALGTFTDPPVRGLAPAIVGAAAIITGVTVLAVSGDSGSPYDPSSAGPYGYGLVISGVVIGAIAAYLFYDSLTSATMQPGTGVQWTPRQ